MQQEHKKYLDPAVLSKIGNLELIARLVVEGFITGLHRSPYHGFSVEFSEHRQYRMGDEIKHLDWKVLARSEKYYIKQYAEETNLRAMVIVDSSASMKYASKGNISKFEYASYLAASIMYLLINQRDAIGLSLYDSGVRGFFPASGRKSYLTELIKELENTTPSNLTNTAPALNEIAERIHRRGLVVIISDFLDDSESILKAISHFRHKKHDVCVFQILDPRELDFNFGSAAQFVDMESSEEMITQPQQIHKAYAKAAANFLQSFKKGCRNLNVDYNFATTDLPFDHTLRAFVAKQTNLY